MAADLAAAFLTETEVGIIEDRPTVRSSIMKRETGQSGERGV